MAALLNWLKQTVTWVWKPLGSVDFTVPLPPHEVLARLRAAIRSERWNYLLGEKVPKSGPDRFVCRIDGRRVTICAKPAHGGQRSNAHGIEHYLELVADVDNAPGGGSRFVGRFAAHSASRLFLVVWAPGLLALAAFAIIAGYFTGEPLSIAFGIVAPLLLALFALAGLADARTTAIGGRDEMLGLLNALYSPHLAAPAVALPPAHAFCRPPGPAKHA